MVMISKEVSRSLSEYLILTDWINTSPEKISLKTKLGNISLEYPFMTARMQSVVGPEMAVTAGRNGILTMIPRSLRDKDKQVIIEENRKACLKKGDIEFLKNPESLTPKNTVNDAINLVERTGYSVIPIMDRFSKLQGVYVHDPDHPTSQHPSTNITKVMRELSKDQNNKEKIFYLDKQIEEKNIKEIFSNSDLRFIPILDKNNILQEIVFSNNFDTNFIGIAVSTRGNWEEEIEKWGSQVDTLTIDSSNACFNDAIKILKYGKEKFPDIPFGIGNIIQGEHFKRFVEEGADYIIGGMGVGSICQTGSERGNGRGQFTVAKELAESRNKYFKDTQKYIPFVLDGGIKDIKDMTVALAFADLIMMGGYFNGFYESPAKKFDSHKNPTTQEASMFFVESWGEGHPRAGLVSRYGMDLDLSKNSQQRDGSIERYGHDTISGATVEGVDGLIFYKGRLRPNVERDARYIRTTISNTGATNLKDFRKRAILERASKMTLEDMLPHCLSEIKGGKK